MVVHGATCTVSWATKRKRKGRKPKGNGEANNGSGSGNNNNNNTATNDASNGGKKKKNLCNMFTETGACSWGSNCKYLHDATRRRT